MVLYKVSSFAINHQQHQQFQEDKIKMDKRFKIATITAIHGLVTGIVSGEGQFCVVPVGFLDKVRVVKLYGGYAALNDENEGRVLESSPVAPCESLDAVIGRHFKTFRGYLSQFGINSLEDLREEIVMPGTR